MTTPKTAPKDVGDMKEKEFLDHLARTASDQAKARSEPVDRVRKKIAFQLLLARLATAASSEYTLKGGYAIEIKFGIVRATKDIDLITRTLMRAAFAKDFATAASLMRQKLVNQLAYPVGPEDRLVRFRVEDDIKAIHGRGGGVQLSARMMVGNQRYTEFSIDLSLEDIKNPVHELVPIYSMVAGVPNPPDIETLANEQILAEKLHAYMRNGQEFKSRPKDLADMVLIAGTGIDLAKARRLIGEVFTFWLEDETTRGLKSLPPTPSTAEAMQPPPEAWLDEYQRLAAGMGITDDMNAGWRAVRDLLAKILHQKGSQS